MDVGRALAVTSRWPSRALTSPGSKMKRPSRLRSRLMLLTQVRARGRFAAAPFDLRWHVAHDALGHGPEPDPHAITPMTTMQTTSADI